MKRSIALVALLFLCCEPPVQHIVTLVFNDTAESVRINATTRLGEAKPGTPEYAQIQDEREALLGARDEWSMRFANADPETDSVTMERHRGKLHAVEHSATIASENLQKFFFDTPLTFTFSRAEGWAELTVYPGTSQRATRQQQQRVNKILANYSAEAARYFGAIRSMYLYLDERPQRASDLFAEIFAGPDEKRPILSDQEHSLTGGVKNALDEMMSSETGASALDREFDLVFNPFPAELRVKVPGEVLSNENFTKLDNGVMAIKMTDALKAVGMLEGRWITPDPLGEIMSALDDTKPEQFVASLAAMPRHAAAVVSPSEIAEALIEKMKPAPRYRLRWITKAVVAPSPPPK